MSLVISLSDFNILNLFLIYSSETQQGIFDAVLKGHTDFDSDPWPLISDNAKDLIRKMLCSDPKERLTAHQVLCECFILYFSMFEISMLDPCPTIVIVFNSQHHLHENQISFPLLPIKILLTLELENLIFLKSETKNPLFKVILGFSKVGLRRIEHWTQLYFLVSNISLQ